MVNIIRFRALWYIFSGVLAALSIVALLVWGLRFGIDFTGGSLLEVSFAQSRPSVDDIRKTLEPLKLDGVAVQPAGGQGMLLRFKHVDEITHQTIVRQLGEAGGGVADELRFETIGPVIGAELQRRSLWALGVALAFIVIYIAWAFRKVSRPVVSWKYGLSAILALAHDAIITIGVFSILGRFVGVEV
ncbi:MAG: protein translocase subunit SecF, partial [Candidatus Veblenbacteria bacterium]|nr:protein translocase subunit SecF [Candidatus Veblenbacteria bacterium]